MKNRVVLLISAFFLAPAMAFGACSSANLTRCLDSVCALNIGANPAARCQYCGSTSAGEPTKSTTMKSVTAGASAKYILSDKELKKAPTDPGARYVWATEQCLNKVSGCDADDVSDIYDPLIEQSCKAAGISAEMTALAKKANTEKTKTSCSTEISTCLIDAKRCTADYRNCESESDFDKYFSECSVAAVGCDAFLKDLRSTLFAEKDTAVKNADKLLANIVTSYQTARQQKMNGTKAACKGDKERLACIERVCANNMRNKCEVGFDYEKKVATELCKFYDIACSRLP